MRISDWSSDVCSSDLSKADASQQLVLSAVLFGIAAAFWFIDSLSDSALMIALTGVVISIAASAGLFIGANGTARLLPAFAPAKPRPWTFVRPALPLHFAPLVVTTDPRPCLSVPGTDGAGSDGTLTDSPYYTPHTTFT